MDIRKRRSAIVQSAIFCSPPLAEFPISEAIAAVRLFVGDRIFLGNALVFPITIATASASPNALASPRIIPEKIPVFAAGRTMRYITCHLVDPIPYAAPRNAAGTLLIASAATVVMVGNIMTASTMEAASTE